MRQFERAVRGVLAIQMGKPVSVSWLMAEFGISRAQAKRDLLELECLLPVVRRMADGRAVLKDCSNANTKAPICQPA